MIIRHDFAAGRALSRLDRQSGETPPAQAARVLLVGFASPPVTRPQLGHLEGRALMAMSEAAWRALSPSMVVAPLIGGAQDAVEIAQRLDMLGFDGAFRVVCPALPDCNLVLAELRRAAPGLDIALLDARLLRRLLHKGAA